MNGGSFDYISQVVKEQTSGITIIYINKGHSTPIDTQFTKYDK